LQTTRVASRSCPESNNITSGVRWAHHEGGSTFVTTGALASRFCAGSAGLERTVELKAKAAAAMERIRIRRFSTDGQSKKTEGFTREA